MSLRTVTNIFTAMIIALVSVYIAFSVTFSITEDLSEPVGVPLLSESLGSSVINEVLMGISIPAIIGISYIIVDYHYVEKKKMEREYSIEALMDEIRITEAIRLSNIRGLEGLTRIQKEKKVVVQFDEQRYTIKPVHKREILDMKPTLGLFDAGIEKFTKKPIEEQEEMLRELDYIKKVRVFSETISEVIINTEKGVYLITISNGSVKAKRIEKDGSFTYRNPYIADTDYGLCIGNAKEIFKRAYSEGNMYECIRLVYQVLISEKGIGFRGWSNCKYRRYF
jgi:hypothetical protein